MPMEKLRWVLVVIIIGAVAFCNDAASAQSGRPTDQLTVAQSNKRFINYQKDFLEFSRAGSADEGQVALDLSTTASQAADYLNAVLTLLTIYDDLSCKEDRDRIRSVIDAEVRFYSKNFELLTREANLDIAQTKMPGVAAEGTRMRDDLRQAKSTFDSIKLPQ
jgi:hypothetical protein